MTDWSFFEAGRVFLPVAEPHDALSVASSCSTIFWRGVAWRGVAWRQLMHGRSICEIESTVESGQFG